MLKEMKALAKEKNICVLATVADGKPYCSLMAYVTDENCKKIYMVTHKNTNKYENLMGNPSVSLLIDTRDISPRSKAKVLTVEGVYTAIESEEKRKKVQFRGYGVLAVCGTELQPVRPESCPFKRKKNVTSTTSHQSQYHQIGVVRFPGLMERRIGMKSHTLDALEKVGG